MNPSEVERGRRILRAIFWDRVGCVHNEGMTTVTERSDAPERGDDVALARAATTEVAGAAAVGEYLRAVVEAENTSTHYFASLLAGYHGWQWACVVSAGERGVTIDEISLIPGPDALVAPEWVPWSERLRAGDVGPGDLVPVEEDDERLAPGFELADDGADDLVDNAVPLGLGRERVLSYEGRALAAERWEHGAHGPGAETAKQAEYNCGTCGFLVALAGSLGHAFGVCANEVSADGEVVSLDFGCGAHSSVRDEEQGPGRRAGTPVDDHALDFEASGAEAEIEAEEEAEAGASEDTATADADADE